LPFTLYFYNLPCPVPFNLLLFTLCKVLTYHTANLSTPGPSLAWSAATFAAPPGPTATPLGRRICAQKLAHHRGCKSVGGSNERKLCWKAGWLNQAYLTSHQSCLDNPQVSPLQYEQMDNFNSRWTNYALPCCTPSNLTLWLPLLMRVAETPTDLRDVRESKLLSCPFPLSRNWPPTLVRPCAQQKIMHQR